jgi:hypothetical protein
MSKPPLPPSV